ncbi:MAG: LysM peptidoglycan-binding domain-containing protein [Phycisphaerales bacterium]|nr:LysM peptidoglycan-binding domain-containing protein [Phycisphaerales bacterium]
MTREHKLALIIGFAILLVVGVLVGDHFSKARHSVAGTDVATTPANTIGLPTDALPVAAAPGMTDGANTSALAPAADPSLRGEQPQDGGQANAIPSTPSTPPRSTTTISMVSGTPGTDPNASGAGAASTPSPTPTPEGGPLVFRPETLRPEPATSIVTVVPTPAPSRVDPAAPGRSGTVVTPPVSPVERLLPVSAGKLLAHPVAKGETLISIARKYYTDAKLASQLAEYNKSRLGSKMTLREGVTLRIPPRDVLVGLARLADDAAVAPGRPENTPPAPRGSEKAPSINTPAPTGAIREYTVVKGDTLGSISQKLLGTVKRAREITALNKDVIRDESNLRVGAKLKIPAR